MTKQAKIMQLASVKAKASVVSGLKLWHAFATTVLCYSAAATIPPRREDDILAYIQLFSNVGTCRNYLCHLMLACTVMGHHDHKWYGPSVKRYIKGLENMVRAVHPGPARTRFLLTRTIFVALSVWFAKEKLFVFKAIHELSWHLLLRTQDECLTVYAGSDEHVTHQPKHIRCSVWIEQGVLNVRLKTRKNKPLGSHLRCGHTCGQGTSCCAVCTLQPLLQDVKDGQKLWQITPANFLAGVRCALQYLELKTAAEGISFKSWRAGKAQWLVDNNHAIGTVLQAGEWAGRAFLHYAVPEMDVQQILPVSWQVPDDEDERADAGEWKMLRQGNDGEMASKKQGGDGKIG